MRSSVIIVLFSLFPLNGWTQSANEGVSELAIKGSFDNLTIQSYAGQAELKVEELFEYIQLLMDQSNSPELNQQLKINIEQLFMDNPALTGIDSKSVVYDPLQWLAGWQNANVAIQSLKLLGSELKSTYWIYNYQLTYSIEGKEKTKKMDVQISFQPQTKSFGKTQKKVWDLKIGNVFFR